MFEGMLIVVSIVSLMYFDFSEYTTKINIYTYKRYEEKVPVLQRIVKTLLFFAFWVFIIWVVDYIVCFKN